MSNVQVDDTLVQNLFNALDDDSRKDILFKALKKGAKKLSDNTKSALLSKFSSASYKLKKFQGKYTRHYPTGNFRGFNTLSKGIRIRPEKDYCEVKVSIMGDYRLKFFESGTDTRTLRRGGASRGRIEPMNFFRAAKLQDITDTIYSSISQSLNRINR